MKKILLFIFSTFIALSIAIYSKRSSEVFASKSNPTWKTFVKNSNLEVSGHKTTQKELEAARVPTPKRAIAEENNQFANDERISFEQQAKIIKDNHFLIREERVLIGDIQKRNYQDEDVPLEMLNKINPNWKDILGHELLRFQDDDTKVMIKEEFSIIQIQNGKGRYVEQVIVTYVLKDGAINSYRALVDSETGSVTDTWDKTISENYKRERANLSLPSENNSGIITR
ncbi:MAG: hypothetical protein H7281_05210 [Bacteriovorax sp.]|nr:hypothetical protein [Bacteriovorax sp.]